jgi:hypothetical protein
MTWSLNQKLWFLKVSPLFSAHFCSVFLGFHWFVSTCRVCCLSDAALCCSSLLHFQRCCFRTYRSLFFSFGCCSSLLTPVRGSLAGVSLFGGGFTLPWLAFYYSLLIINWSQSCKKKKKLLFRTKLWLFKVTPLSSSFFRCFFLSILLCSTIFKISLRVLVLWDWMLVIRKGLCLAFTLHYFFRVFDDSFKSCMVSNFGVSFSRLSTCLHFVHVFSASYGGLGPLFRAWKISTQPSFFTTFYHFLIIGS